MTIIITDVCTCLYIYSYLKNYYLFLSREQASYRRNLDEDLLSHYEEKRLNRLNIVTDHKNNITEINDEASEASSNLVKAKQSYVKILNEVELARQKLNSAEKNLQALRNLSDSERRKKKEEENKYSMGRLFSAFERTPEEEVKYQAKKLSKSEAEMQAILQEIEDKKKILLDKIEKKEYIYNQVCGNYCLLF